MAHELDHLIHHDATEHLRAKEGAAAAAWLMQTSAMMGGMVVSVLVSSPGPLGGIGSNACQNAVYATGTYGAEELEVGIVTGFTAETELRADANGMKMLQTAGFDPEANIRMLHLLQNLTEEPLEKERLAASSLINMKPGVATRIEHLQSVLSELQR